MEFINKEFEKVIEELQAKLKKSEEEKTPSIMTTFDAILMLLKLKGDIRSKAIVYNRVYTLYIPHHSENYNSVECEGEFSSLDDLKEHLYGDLQEDTDIEPIEMTGDNWLELDKGNIPFYTIDYVVRKW